MATSNSTPIYTTLTDVTAVRDKIAAAVAAAQALQERVPRAPEQSGARSESSRAIEGADVNAG
jgi:hypothetical protein